MKKAHVHPVRVIRRDDDLHANVRRVVAYRAECSCGWRSSTQPTYWQARVLMRRHRVAGCWPDDAA